MSKQLQVRVTKRAIALGRRALIAGDVLPGEQCKEFRAKTNPITEALSLAGHNVAAVYEKTAHVDGHIWALPDDAVRFLDAFAAEQPVKPFNVAMELVR